MLPSRGYVTVEYIWNGILRSDGEKWAIQKISSKNFLSQCHAKCDPAMWRPVCTSRSSNLRSLDDRRSSERLVTSLAARRWICNTARDWCAKLVNYENLISINFWYFNNRSRQLKAFAKCTLFPRGIRDWRSHGSSRLLVQSRRWLGRVHHTSCPYGSFSRFWSDL